MNRDTAAGYVLIAWLVAVGLISVRSVVGSQGQPFPAVLPKPSLYLGSAVLYTMLWGATFIAPTLAVTLAVGMDVAIFAQPYIQGSNTGLADSVSSWLNTVSPSQPTGTQ